jgi:uncharacterized DUF497 family protein
MEFEWDHAKDDANRHKHGIGLHPYHLGMEGKSN